MYQHSDFSSADSANMSLYMPLRLLLLRKLL
jgi:hypothetical protein